jgi:hypothetical protein
MGKRFKLSGDIPKDRILSVKADEMITRKQKDLRGIFAHQLSALGVDPNSPTQVELARHMIMRQVEQHGADIVVTWHYGKTLLVRMYWNEVQNEKIFIDTPRLRKAP